MKLADRYVRAATPGTPRISVAVLTYRHEAFIADAMDSVLMQDTDDPVEIVIGEDCSPDASAQVIEGYMRRYPGLIKLHRHERNIGTARNTIHTLNRCRGDYVALLDGDDYWTSPDKLRRQVALLDRYRRFSMCFHAVNRVRGGRIVKPIVRPTGRRAVYRLEDLAHWINISTSSMLFRRSALPDFPPWFADVNLQNDWALQVLLAEQGDIAYLPELMGTHRLHETNMWAERKHVRSEVLSKQITDLELFRQHIGDPRRARSFARSRRQRRYELLHAHLDEGRSDKARELFTAGGGLFECDLRASVFEPWLFLLHLHAPRLYGWLHLDAAFLNQWLRRIWGRTAGPLLDRDTYREPLARWRWRRVKSADGRLTNPNV